MSTSTHHTILVGVVAIAISFALFGNGIRAQYTYDDGPGIQHRQDLKDPRNLFRLFVSPYYFQQPEIGLYRPLPMVSYLLNYSLFGPTPVSFHVVNILLHALASILVFFLTVRLTLRTDLSWVTFLLFLTHPIHTEAVTLIVGRAEILAFIFSLAFLSLHMKGKYLWAALCFFAALLSKEIAVMALPLLFFIEWTQYEKKQREYSVMIPYLTYTMPLIVYFALRFLALGPYTFYSKALDFVENPLPFVNFSERILTALKVLTLYIEKLIYPMTLTNDYSYNVIPIVKHILMSWESLLAIVIIMTILLLAVHPKTKQTPLGLGAVLFFLPYFLISNLVLTVGTIMAERLMYFSSYGFALMMAYVLLRLPIRFNVQRTTLWTCLAIILVLYGIRTVIRNEEWLSNDRLYAPNLKNHPEGFLTQLYWGTTLIGKNQIEEGKKHLLDAQKIYANNPALITTFGSLAELEGNTDLAEKYYKEAIAKYNLAIGAYAKLGYLYFTKQQYDLAADNLLRAVSLYPNPSDISFYARTQIQLNTSEKGIEIIKKYFGANPEDIEVVTALGYSYYVKDDYANALIYLNKSRLLGNVNPEMESMIEISKTMIAQKNL